MTGNWIGDDHAASPDHNNDLKKRGIAFRSLTEQMDTTTPQGEFLFHVFAHWRNSKDHRDPGARSAGLAAARRRGQRGRPAAADAVLAGGSRRWTPAPPRPACRTFGIKRSTLIDPGLGRLVCWYQGPGGMSWHDYSGWNEAQLTELFDPTEQRELVRHYTCRKPTRTAINRCCRGDHNRLGWLPSWRYPVISRSRYAHCERPPTALLAFIIEQIDVLPHRSTRHCRGA